LSYHSEYQNIEIIIIARNPALTERYNTILLTVVNFPVEYIFQCHSNIALNAPKMMRIPPNIAHRIISIGRDSRSTGKDMSFIYI